MKVKVVHEHVNNYGDKPKKAVGTEYELPDAMGETLVAAGLVTEVKAKSAASEKPQA